MRIEDYQEATLEGATVEREIADDPLVMDWRRDAGWNTLESLLGIGAGGKAVGITEAFRQDAVLACVDVISRDISKVDFCMYRRLPDGGKKRVLPREHWFAGMLARDPNEEHNWGEFWQMMAIHLVMANNAFIVKETTRIGDVRELIPVMPGRVMIHHIPHTGEIIYQVTRGSTFEQSVLRDVGYLLGRDDVIHLRKRIVDGLYGYSTLAAGAPTINLAKAIKNYQDRLYENDGQSRVVVQQSDSMKPLSTEAFLRMKGEVRRASRNMFRQGEAMLLEPGYSASLLAMTAADAELSKVRDAQIAAVARVFGVPPHKIGYMSDTKYSNLEVFERAYAHDVLIPIARCIEMAIARSILSDEERLDFFFEFDRKRMEIVDFKQRAEALRVGLQHGSVMPDEFREEFNLNPLPHGAGRVRMFQSTMTVVDERNQVVIAAGAKKPAEEDPAADDDEENKEDGASKRLRLVQ